MPAENFSTTKKRVIMVITMLLHVHYEQGYQTVLLVLLSLVTEGWNLLMEVAHFKLLLLS